MEICSERLYNPWKAELSAEVSCINKNTCYLSHFMAISMYIKKSGINTFNVPTNVNISVCNAWRNFWHFLLFQLEERKLNRVLKTNNIIISSFAALCAGFRLSRLPGDNKIMLISSSQSPITENSLGWHMTCCELILTLYVNTGKTYWISGCFFWTVFSFSPVTRCRHCSHSHTWLCGSHGSWLWGTGKMLNSEKDVKNYRTAIGGMNKISRTFFPSWWHFGIFLGVLAWYCR